MERYRPPASQGDLGHDDDDDVHNDDDDHDDHDDFMMTLTIPG